MLCSSWNTVTLGLVLGLLGLGGVATNATNSLKDGLESFTHTPTHPRGQATTRWDREALTLTSESAERRTSRRILDTEGRPLRLEVGAFEPVNFEYDARSRPVRVTQGTRERSLTYDEDGYVASPRPTEAPGAWATIFVDSSSP